jgi:hypothetical protein
MLGGDFMTCRIRAAFVATFLIASGANAQTAWEATGEGTVTDGTHPKHPGDVTNHNVRVRLALDDATGEGEITILDKDDAKSPPDRRFWRRGRLFQLSDSGEDLPAEGVGDLAPATIALLHPALLAAFLRERPENADTTNGAVGGVGGTGSPRFISCSDVLWHIEARPGDAGSALAPTSLSRMMHDDVYGSMRETVQYDGRRVTVTRSDRTIATLVFAEPTPIEKLHTPKGDSRRDTAVVVPSEEFVFRELGGGLFACELARTNARVFVVEFEDRLLVFEGIFTSRNAESLADAVRSRFKKPVSFFAFSHIHGQYVGGVRAWAHEGATILVPPSSVTLVERALAAPFQLRPDAWSRDPKSPRVEPVAERWTREDSSASVVILNDPQSDHTDEYFIVYLPRIKTMLTGDLLFYRPNQPLAGRSLTLARYIDKLGLQVDRLVPTWPLEWAGKNELTGEEMREAANAGDRPPAKKR